MDENPGGRHLKETDSMTAEIELIAACHLAVSRFFFVDQYTLQPQSTLQQYTYIVECAMERETPKMQLTVMLVEGAREV